MATDRNVLRATLSPRSLKCSIVAVAFDDLPGGAVEIEFGQPGGLLTGKCRLRLRSQPPLQCHPWRVPFGKEAPVEAQGVERGLAVILAADATGYGRLMEVEEEATLRALTARS